MSQPPSPKRFVVADLGFAYGVFDTAVPQEYGFEAGKDAKHPSNNSLNSRRVGVFATREQAEQDAAERNAREGAA